MSGGSTDPPAKSPTKGVCPQFADPSIGRNVEVVYWPELAVLRAPDPQLWGSVPNRESPNSRYLAQIGRRTAEQSNV